MTLKQRAELFRRHSDDGQDVPQGALGHVATRMDGNRNSTPIGMLHDSVEDHADDIAPGGTRQSALARKYRPLAPVLRELILRADTPLAHDVKLMNASQLGKAKARTSAPSSSR